MNVIRVTVDISRIIDVLREYRNKGYSKYIVHFYEDSDLVEIRFIKKADKVNSMFF